MKEKESNMKKFFSLALALCMSLSLLTACGAEKEAETPEAPAAPENMVFTYVVSPLNVPSIIERDQGIFAKHLEPLGASVEYTEITSGADQTQALASGDVQVLYAWAAPPSSCPPPTALTSRC